MSYFSNLVRPFITLHSNRLKSVITMAVAHVSIINSILSYSDGSSLLYSIMCAFHSADANTMQKDIASSQQVAIPVINRDFQSHYDLIFKILKRSKWPRFSHTISFGSSGLWIITFLSKKLIRALGTVENNKFYILFHHDHFLLGRVILSKTSVASYSNLKVIKA